MKFKTLLFVLFLLTSKLMHSQKGDLDTLSYKSFKELKKIIKTSKNDSIKYKYVQYYLKKAKRERDTLKIIKTFKYQCLYFYPDSISTKYADSLISFSKEKHYGYAAFAHNIKGNIFFEYGDYKNALNEYILASKFASSDKDDFKILILKFNIGLIKNHLDERNEALEIFIEYLKHAKKLKGVNSKEYLKGLYAVADSYTYLKKNDTANVYIKRGIDLSLKLKDSLIYQSFVLTSGIQNYFNKKYTKSIDSLKKVEKLYTLTPSKSKQELSISNYYISKSLHALNRHKESIKYFKKVDSLLYITNDITTELIDSYNYLIADAKKNKSLELQIKYINSFIRFDSILDNNYKYIKSTLVKNYETPELINQKEKIIVKLNKNNKNSKKIIVRIISITIFLILIIAFLIRRNLIQKKKFEKIVNKASLAEKKNNELIKINNTELPEKIVEEILLALDIFEKSYKYLTKKYTLNSLAKELKTNSTYLSKVINLTKKINFSNYLNNLKIDYAIKRLTKEKKFRSYTVKAIALESGFSNAQTFSVAFHNKTGLYPSYFIKKINKT